MDEKPFRVLLDFSEVNTGISGLKYVWMHISPRELNTINDFKQAIIRKFSFSEDGFKLFVRDGLLLETEKIAILREDDTVKIQLENPIETAMEHSAANMGIDISVAQKSSYSLSSNAVVMNKSRKRKSETFTTTSTENANLSANLSKKKKKQDKPGCISNESTNFSGPEELSMNLSQEDLSNLDKNSKSNSSSNTGKNNKQPMRSKKRPHPKTPTADFITFAVKLSEAERNIQNVCQSDVNATSSKRVKNSMSDTNLYKTAEIVSKTHLSPIPESNTYELSSFKSQDLNLTESFDNSASQLGQSSVFEEVVDGKDSCKRKRRRKRKRKVIPSSDDLCLSADVNTELGGSFLTDIKSNETYDASSDTRKHIIFHSPTSPKISTTITLNSSPNSSFDEPQKLPIGNNNFKIYSELDSPKNKSLKEDSQLDPKVDKGCESVISEIGDFTKESTPFSKKKLKGKAWGVTPLPKISSSSNTLLMENSDTSRTDVVKPAYQDCTPLNCLPPVGTRLAYKILELNEDYCPEVTEYKEGILRKVDPNTDELEIELIQEEFKSGRSGKFENLWKDEPPPDDQVVKMVSLNWSALIEPRLVPQ